ncbi:MAG: hypothetical protein QF921_14725 [Pseudomonadales bacterium]|nr:hypothetical protein [Pseudomonadales bacterium]MDP6469695.1 hypothetical protein [Pseudomonadales bacterium]MDP6828936.1 hypothetical protein [Pseudomonadales bacterium]MDP6972736.1 hypothetical protein [Pseudomonadales bacterium]|tara:strand:+ start:411 stop:686 length:276 start_codon:yes stop_codon:yes gene_type:complete
MTHEITTDVELLALCAVHGKLPELGVLISVEEAFGHCSKAFRRSKLWQDDYVAIEGIPTLAEMMSGHLDLDDATSEILKEGIRDDVRTRMY